MSYVPASYSVASPDHHTLLPFNLSHVAADRLHEFLGFLSSTKDGILTLTVDYPVTAQEELQDLFPDTFIAPFYLLFAAAVINCITNLVFNLVSEWREERKYRAATGAGTPSGRLAISIAKIGAVPNKGGVLASGSDGSDDDNHHKKPSSSPSKGDPIWKRIASTWRGDTGNDSERAPLIADHTKYSTINDDDEGRNDEVARGNPKTKVSFSDERTSLRCDYGSERTAPSTTSKQGAGNNSSLSGSRRPVEDDEGDCESLVGVSTQFHIEETIAEGMSHDTRSTHQADFASSAIDGRAKGLMYSPAYALQRKGKGSAAEAEAAQVSSTKGELPLAPAHNEKRRLRRWYYLLMHPNQMFITVSIIKAAFLMLMLFYHIQATGGWDRFVILAAANIFSGQLSAVFTFFVCRLLPVHRSVLWSSVFGWTKRAERRPINRRIRRKRQRLNERESRREHGQMHTALAPTGLDDDEDGVVGFNDSILHENPMRGDDGSSTDTSSLNGPRSSSSNTHTSTTTTSSHTSQQDWDWDNDDMGSVGTVSRGHSPLNVRFGIYAPGLEDGMEEDDPRGSDASWSDDSASVFRRQVSRNRIGGTRRKGEDNDADAGDGSNTSGSTNGTVTTPSTPDTMSTPSSETSEESIQEFRARITPWMQPRRDRNHAAANNSRKAPSHHTRKPVARKKGPSRREEDDEDSEERNERKRMKSAAAEEAALAKKEAKRALKREEMATETTYSVPTAANMGHPTSEGESGSESGEEDESEEESEEESDTTSSEEFSEDEDDDDVVLSWRQRQRHQRSSGRRSSMATTVMTVRGRARRNKSCLSRCCPAPVSHLIRRVRKNLGRLPRKAKKWCSAVASLPDWVSLDYIFLRYDYLNLEDLSYVFTHGTVFITVSSFIVPVFLWFVIPGLALYFWLLIPIPLLAMLGCRLAYRVLYVFTVRHSRKLHNSTLLHNTSILGRARAQVVPSVLVFTSSMVLAASRIILMGVYTWAFQAAMIYAAIFIFQWDGMTSPTNKSSLDITFSGCSTTEGKCIVSLRDYNGRSTPLYAGQFRGLPGDGHPVQALVAPHRQADLHTSNRYISVIELELRARLVPVPDYIKLVLDGRITPPPHQHDPTHAPHPTHTHDPHRTTETSPTTDAPPRYLDTIYLRKGAVVMGMPVVSSGNNESESDPSILFGNNATIPGDDIIVTPYWMRLTLLAGQVLL